MAKPVRFRDPPTLKLGALPSKGSILGQPWRLHPPKEVFFSSLFGADLTECFWASAALTSDSVLLPSNLYSCYSQSAGYSKVQSSVMKWHRGTEKTQILPSGSSKIRIRTEKLIEVIFLHKFIRCNEGSIHPVLICQSLSLKRKNTHRNTVWASEL